MNVSEVLRRQQLAGNISIDPRLKLNDTLQCESEIVAIDQVGIMGSGVTCFSGVVIEMDACIGNDVVLGRNVKVGVRANLERGVIALRNATIGARAGIWEDTVIGPDVNIAGHTQLGQHQIVPTNKTIVTMGAFGTSRRVVTIHGSEHGPLYSIGCQFSVPEETITRRIRSSAETSSRSAQHYRRYLPIFSAVGAEVQREFDRLAKSGYVEQVRAESRNLRLRADDLRA